MVISVLNEQQHLVSIFETVTCDDGCWRKPFATPAQLRNDVTRLLKSYINFVWMPSIMMFNSAIVSLTDSPFPDGT